MAGKTHFLENALLNAILKATGSIPAPASLFVALNTSASTPSTPGTEDADANYARQSVPSWSSGGPGADYTLNGGGSLAFYGAGRAAGSATIVEIALYDSLSGGNELWYGTVSPSVLIGTGDTASLAGSAITVIQGGLTTQWAQSVLAAITKMTPTAAIPYAYVPPTAATQLYCALNTTTSGGIGPGTEVADANYSRQQFSFGAVSNGSVATNAVLNFFGAGAASGPHTIVEASVYDAPVTQSGSTASITGPGPTLTLTGLTGMTAACVGSPITISGAATGGNNGMFIIASFISASSVTITNASGGTDANNGAITWKVGNELYFASLSASKTVNAGDTLKIASGNFTVTES